MEQEWRPVQLHSSLANTTEDIDRNLEAAITGNYTPFTALIGKSRGTVHVVGSGPSLLKNWPKLKRAKGDILACNAAYKFLLGKGIKPKYMMCFDADPLMLQFIEPHKDIIYLLASRCPPESFELLKGCNVVRWHAAGDVNLDDILSKHRCAEPMIKGGTAAITRAMILVLPMGYTDVHLWGCDSSFDGANTHIGKSTTEEKRLAINCGARVFECSPWMAQQAEDFKILAPSMASHGAKLTVHGDGLIPHLAKIMGYPVDGSRLAHWLRGFVFKARLVWSTV